MKWLEDIDRPDEFRTDRPSTSYLHFGHGQHTCFGARINQLVVPLAIKALLELEDLRYADEGPSEIEYDGPFPNRMRLRFGPPE